MLRVYISSTYNDLAAYRDAVADGLKQLGHLPVGMEDYVAEGKRPLAKCVEDVADSDVYVGIFAYRYGFIPLEPANPERRSITELELATAREKLGDDRCLIFLVDPNEDWKPGLMDSTTGEGENGKRIRDLKTRLGNDFTVSHFKTAEHLTQLVNTAVARLPPPPERHVRQLAWHTVFAYADPADAALAQGIAQALGAQGMTTRLVPRVLFAALPVDFLEAEREVVQSHSALLLITPALLGLLKALPDQGARAIQLMHERTGVVIALLRGVAAADLPAAWPVVPLPADGDAAATALVAKTAIAARCPTWDRPTVGLPYIVLAMRRTEAADLVEGRDPASQDARFQQLLPGLERDPALLDRYGAEPRAWRPFGPGKTAEEIAGEIAMRVNDGGPRLGHRYVKLQYYALEPWLQRDAALLDIYRTLLATGCVAVVDQVSLFHAGVCDAIASFLGRASAQVAVVAMSPPEGLTRDEVRLIEQQARERLRGIFERFDAELDPTCEFGVAEERRLRRWLSASVPTAVNNLADPRPDEGRKRRFRELVGPQVTRMGTEALLWPDRAR